MPASNRQFSVLDYRLRTRATQPRKRSLRRLPPPVSNLSKTKLRTALESTEFPKNEAKTKLNEAETCQSTSAISHLESAKLETGSNNEARRGKIEAETWKLALGFCLLLFATPIATRAFPQRSSSQSSAVQPLDPNADLSQHAQATQTGQTKAPPAAPPQDPQELAALMRQAEDALQRKDYQSAIGPLQRITAAAPDTAAAWYYLGYAQHGLHDDGDARQSYEKAVALKPDLAEAQVNLGSLLLAERDFAGALPHLQAAVKLKPNDAHARLELGAALQGAGQPEAANQEFQRASALDPKSATAFYEAGHAALREKRYAEAAADLTKALAARPDDAGAERDLALADEALGRTPEAAQHFAEYLKLRPADTAVRVHLAQIYLDQKQPDLALAQLERAESMPTPPPEVEASIGDAYAGAGKFADAEVHYRKALQALGGQAALHRALAEALLKEKKNAEAEAEFRKALEIDPGSLDALKGLASSIYLEGRYADAAPLVERLLQAPGASPGLYFILATCYDHLRDKHRALAAYQEFLTRAHGSNPDQEWQAEQRARLLRREIQKGL